MRSVRDIVEDGKRASQINVIIVGGGPAGMSSALWLVQLGFNPIIIECEKALGGIQNLDFHPNPWVLGIPGQTGAKLAERLVQHLQRFSPEIHTGAVLTDIKRATNKFRIKIKTSAGGELVSAHYLIIATGTRPKSTARLTELAAQSNRVLIGPTAVAIHRHISGKRVLILGGGDNALDNALYLAKKSNRVTVCARTDFSARAAFVEQGKTHPAIQLRTREMPQAFRLAGDEIAVRIARVEYRFDYAIVLFGYRPNSELPENTKPELRPRLSKRGFIAVDPWQWTSVPGILAIGDVTNLQHPCVSTAIAQGAVAAKAISLKESIAR